MNQVLNSELFEAFANASDRIYIYVSEMKSGMTRWSKSAVEYFALPGEYIQDTNEIWLEHIHPDDREIYLQDILAVLDGTSKFHNCQYRARNRYGEYNWVECKGSVIYDKNGEPEIFAGLMTRLDNINKYDPVTHLMTGYDLLRNGFGENGALMMVGIDGFRKINSDYGITYGNEILKFLSNVFLEKVNGASVYRFLGDEYVVYAPNMSADDLVKIYDDVMYECINHSGKKDLISFTITGSIVEFTENEGAPEIVAKAEQCFNYAKEKNVANVTVYSEDIEKKINRKKIVSEELLDCIEDDFRGFRLVYQPIFANSGDSVVACEALLRWKTDKEEIGNCYPDEFISILESNGGMTDVGYFVMRESIRQASVWQKRFKDFNVSFNVSYVQLEDTDFVPAIIETVKKYDVDPTRIVVELTESVLNVDTVKVKHSFELLREHGIKIALDDFGTGNSSFWMLHNIDVDIVKLDQSFIRGLENDAGIDYAIVESVDLMCNRIGCKTVAEGIETEEIWKIISDFCFTGLQGYLFSRPIEVPDFEELLEKYNMVKS